jgi:hypothetical protein
VAFQFFAAIEQSNGMLLLYSLALIIGPLSGGFLASYFFRHIYAPLKEGLALQKVRTSHIEEDDFYPSDEEEHN